MRRDSFFMKLISTYILILSASVIVIAAVLNYKMRQDYRLQYDKTMETSINAKMEFCEEQLSRVRSSAIMLMFHNDMKGVLNAVSKVDQIFAVQRMQTLLSTEMLKNSLIYNIYVYLAEVDKVFTSNKQAHSLESFYDLSWRDEAEAGWQTARVIDDHSSSLTRTPLQVEVFTYLHHMQGNQSLEGELVINVDKSALYDLLISPNDQPFYLLDSEGIILLSEDIEECGKPFFQMSSGGLKEQLAGGNGQVSGPEGDKAFVIKGKSGFHYALLYDSGQMLFHMNMLSALVFVISAAIILIGIPVCLAIAKRIYNPIGKLLSQIKREVSLDASLSRNEWQVLSAAFDELTRENALFNRLIEKGRRHIEADMANKLLLGDCSEDMTQEELCSNLRGKHICVTLISVDKFRGHEESELLSLSGEIIRQISKSSLQSSFESYHTARTAGLAASIIALDAPDEREKLLEMLAMLQAMLMRVLGRSVSISVSSLCTQPEQIADAYQEALGMMRQRLVMGEGCIFSHPPDAATTEEFVYPKVILEKIRQAIEREDCPMFEETLGELAETVKGQGIGVDNIYLIYYQIVNHIIELVLSRHMQPSVMFTNEAELYRRVSDFENIYAMNEWFVELLKNTLAGFNKERSKKEEILSAFTQYVQEGYSSPLYPEEVAGRLGVSYSYLRKLLQTELGLSFLDYVNQVRTGHAKNLLARTDKTIEQIAKSVGYSNRQSFVRAFKKLHNQTPGSFRQKHSRASRLDSEMI